MNKHTLPILAFLALTQQSCYTSDFPGNDPGNRCTINDVKWSCSRTDATTLYIKALLLNNNFDCRWDEDIPVWVTVYNTQWGVVSYKFRPSNNPNNPNNTPLEDERPNQTVLLKPDQSLRLMSWNKKYWSTSNYRIPNNRSNHCKKTNYWCIFIRLWIYTSMRTYCIQNMFQNRPKQSL